MTDLSYLTELSIGDVHNLDPITVQTGDTMCVAYRGHTGSWLNSGPDEIIFDQLLFFKGVFDKGNVVGLMLRDCPDFTVEDMTKVNMEIEGVIALLRGTMGEPKRVSLGWWDLYGNVVDFIRR